MGAKTNRDGRLLLSAGTTRSGRRRVHLRHPARAHDQVRWMVLEKKAHYIAVIKLNQPSVSGADRGPAMGAGARDTHRLRNLARPAGVPLGQDHGHLGKPGWERLLGSAANGGLLARAVEIKRSAAADGVDQFLECCGRGLRRPCPPVALQRGPGRQPATDGPECLEPAGRLGLLGHRFSPSLTVLEVRQGRVAGRLERAGVGRTRCSSRS